MSQRKPDVHHYIIPREAYWLLMASALANLAIVVTVLVKVIA